MNNLLKKLKHGTILEEPVRIQGTILRASVIAPGGPGCSSLVFVLEEDPSIAYQVQNWAVGNHQIVFSAAGDKVSFLYRQGLRSVLLESFENQTYQNLIASNSSAQKKAPHRN